MTPLAATLQFSNSGVYLIAHGAVSASSPQLSAFYGQSPISPHWQTINRLIFEGRRFNSITSRPARSMLPIIIREIITPKQGARTRAAIDSRLRARRFWLAARVRRGEARHQTRCHSQSTRDAELLTNRAVAASDGLWTARSGTDDISHKPHPIKK